MTSINQFEKYSITYNHSHCSLTVSQFLLNSLKPINSTIAILCIGTDRSTGDSYGPLTGTLLLQSKLNRFIVFGTLMEPVHAINLEKTIHSIYEKDPNTFIIAIDASLGKSKSVGKLVYGTGQLEPGKALNKKLPKVGNIFITSIVNIGGLMEYIVLQNTRLSLVYQMAKMTAEILKITDNALAENTKKITNPITKAN